MKYNNIIRIIALLSIAAGLIVLIGWVFDVGAFKSILPDYATMKVNTAISFVIAGIAMYSILNFNYKTATILCLTLITIGLLSVTQDLLNVNLGIDELFIKDHETIANRMPHPGRMATSTAICLSLLGVSLLLISTRRFKVLSQYLLHVISLLSFIAIVGYFYTVPSLYTLSFLSSMAIHTAIMLFILSIGTSLFNPDLGFTGLFTGNKMGNEMARRLFPTITITILGLGFFRTQSHKFNFVSVEFGIALFAISFIMVSLFLICSVAKQLDNIDRKRTNADIALKNANQHLEKLLEENSEEFRRNTQLLESSQAISRVGGWELDLTTGQLYWTAETYRIHDTSPEEFNPTVDAGVGYFLPESKRQISEALDLAMTKGIGYDLYLETYTTKGRKIEVRTTCLVTQVDGKPTKLTGIFQDITEKKMLELEKEAILKHLNYALDASGDGIWDWTPFNGVTVFSKAWVEMLGFEVGELPFLASEWSDRLHPDEAEWVTASINAVTQTPENGDTFSHEYRFRNKADDYLWILNKAKVVERNEIGQAIRVVGTHTNITEQKRKQAEIAAISKEIKDITNAVNESTALSISNTQGTFVKVNKQLCDISGYTEEELIGQNHNILNSNYHDSVFWQNQRQTIMAGKTWKGEIKKRKKDGSDYWVNAVIQPIYDDSGQVVQFLSFRQDITEQKKSEKALKESELRLNLATKVGGIGVFDWDILANKLTWDNQMFALYGVKREVFTSALDAWSDGVYEADREQGKLELELALKGEKEFNTEFRIQHPNGEIRNVRALGTVIRDAEGNATRMIGTNWDITKEKEALRQIEQAKEQAESASKAKSEFLANMSHEIRTPLNGVIGFTELLTKTPLSPIQQQYANSANVSGHTLLGIINDILDFSKIEAGMLELEEIKTDMVVLLENSIDIVKFTAADKGLELLLDIDPAMPRFAYIDPIRTKQILANLLSNAIKFTQKGEVALKAVYQALDGKQGELSISVRDTGIGITEEQKSKLFKSFSQADSSTTRKFGGTGLGLVISQMITEKMGSKIQIDSTPDVSTTFYFDIITNFEEGEKIYTTKIADVKRCLIIDDNDNNRLILKQMLNQWQIVSDSCTNALEAVKQIANSKPYDVIICDYNMPYIDGLETIRMMKDKLKLSTKKLPVILLHSSLNNTDLNKKCEELQIHLLLNKPVKSHELFNSLSQLHQTLAAIPQKETEQVAKVSNASEKIKILIAEDNSLNMVLSKTMLAQLMPNSKLYEAKNGLEAIELYRSTAPDLIFMDVQMPELDGIEATKKIRTLEGDGSTHLPIIALTAGALKEEKDKCIAAGMDDFLTKPLETQKIQTVLNKYFAQEKKVAIVLQGAVAENEAHFGFNELVRNLGNEMEIVQDLMSIFITNMPTTIEQIEQAYNEIDLANIKVIAHSITGTSLSMRCSALADIAGKIENATKDNSFENIEILLAELKKEWEIVHNLLLQKIDH